jgi:hypothetical protein
MTRLVPAAVTILVVAGCGGSKPAASGPDAMTSLSDFQLELDKAQKEGKITLDQLLAARDKLFSQTQAAQEKEDWATYCQAIDDTPCRAEAVRRQGVTPITPRPPGRGIWAPPLGPVVRCHVWAGIAAHVNAHGSWT